MKNYEAIFIVNSSLNEKEQESAFLAINDTIKKNSGSVINSEKMGKKKLAYKIKKFREGIYYKVDFEMDAKLVDELKKVFYLNANIVRFVILKKDSVNVST